MAIIAKDPALDALSLTDLESYDSRAPRASRGERRFLCPKCGDSKPHNRAHRSLALNVNTGAWVCHRCGEKGLLREHWTKRPAQTARQRTRAAVARAFSLAPVVERQPKNEPSLDPHVVIASSVAIESTPGAAYIEGRGIPVEVAHEAGVRFAESFYGRPAVLFPMYDRDGALVAVNGRFVDGRNDPKTQTAGSKSLGLFTTPGALSASVTAVCEGAMDALSLWLCGVSSVALVGTSAPDWLPSALAFSCALIATDADVAGDRAATELENSLSPRACRTLRLRPRIANDWGEALERAGADKLREQLAPFSEIADTPTHVNAACALGEKNRTDDALFVASLIDDAQAREWVRSALRRGALVGEECFNEQGNVHVPAWMPLKHYRAAHDAIFKFETVA
jgi:predicted RNA-binding Zn-ribbon protein involved in translation (DUF1610 family)